MKNSKAICVLAIVGLLSSTLGGCTVGNTQIRLETIQLHSHKTVFQINSNKCELKYAKLYMCNYRNLYGRAYGMDLEPYDFGSDSLEDYVKDVTLQELARIYCMDMIAQQKKMSLMRNSMQRRSSTLRILTRSMSSCGTGDLADRTAPIDTYFLRNRLDRLCEKYYVQIE